MKLFTKIIISLLLASFEGLEKNEQVLKEIMEKVAGIISGLCYGR